MPAPSYPPRRGSPPGSPPESPDKIECVERSLLPKAKISSTTYVKFTMVTWKTTTTSPSFKLKLLKCGEVFPRTSRRRTQQIKKIEIDELSL